MEQYTPPTPNYCITQVVSASFVATKGKDAGVEETNTVYSCKCEGRCVSGGRAFFSDHKVGGSIPSPCGPRVEVPLKLIA